MVVAGDAGSSSMLSPGAREGHSRDSAEVR